MPVTKPDTFETLVRRIQRNNRIFENGTPAQKILMVARDVLSLLEFGRIDPTHGIYFRMDQVDLDKTGREFCQLSDVLKMSEGPVCHVCAIGAGMVAATLRLNDVKVKTYDVEGGLHFCWYNKEEVKDDVAVTDNGEYSMSSRANEVFGDVLLRRMEEAFEGGSYGYGMMSEGYDRLHTIYQNLVRNKGKKFTDYGSGEVVHTIES